MSVQGTGTCDGNMLAPCDMYLVAYVDESTQFIDFCVGPTPDCDKDAIMKESIASR